MDRISLPSSHVGLGPEIPLSCLTIDCGLIPDLNARDISLLIASDCAAAFPPALPIVVNTSQRPCSSSLIVMYSVPSPVFMRLVSP